MPFNEYYNRSHKFPARAPDYNETTAFSEHSLNLKVPAPFNAPPAFINTSAVTPVKANQSTASGYLTHVPASNIYVPYIASDVVGSSDQ